MTDNENEDIGKLYEMGKTYENNDKNLEAITECYLKIIEADPSDDYAMSRVGSCYYKLEEIKLAIHYFKKARKICETGYLHHNLGLCYVAAKDYASAEKSFFAALKYESTYSIASDSLGTIYYYMKKYNTSIKCYENKECNESDCDKLLNLSFPYLAKKNFEKGFELYESRLGIKTIGKQMMHYRFEVPSLRYWNGIDKCNKLLIIEEQGLGDMVQFFRFIIELADLHPNMEIIFFCKKNLEYFFNSRGKFIVTGEMEVDAFSGFDYNIYLMSLPRILGIKKITPNIHNYINFSFEKGIMWRNRLSMISREKPKIGFVYNGLLSSFIEKNIPLEEFQILCDLDVDLICMHRKKDIQEDMENYEKTKENYKNRITFFDIDNEIAFDDTIHILKNLDLLITIDTISVHLAGVLNVKTWLLLGYSDWRWSKETTSTYWYNSVELIRTTNEDFKDIIKTKVKDKLSNFIKSI